MVLPTNRELTDIVTQLSETPEIEESEFVRTWLLTLREYISGGQIPIGIWLDGVKASPHQEVRVVDGGGNELFRVPPIIVNETPVFSKAILEQLGSISYHADNLDKIIPGSGQQYIRDMLADDVQEQKTIPSIRERWDAIFARYNLEPVFTQSKTTVEQRQRDAEAEEFEDYDEL